MEFLLTHPDEGIKNIIILFDGVPYETDSTHPRWDEIIDLVLEDDAKVIDLLTDDSYEVDGPNRETPSYIGSIDPEHYAKSLADPGVRETLRRAQISKTLGGEGIESRVEQQRDQIVFLSTLVIKLSDRAYLLEAAVKQYAEHIWNDIDQRLNKVTS